MSSPFVCILIGFALVMTMLMFGGKGGVPMAFLVGGTMILGGLVVGVMRSLPGRRQGKNEPKSE